jgi:two-component system response regulator FixJ
MTLPTIHIVDDEPAVRSSLAMLVGCWGYDVQVHEGGPALLSGAPLEAADVILLDVRMPDMNGLEVLAALRDRAWTAPVIMMTGHPDQQMKAEAVRRGVQGFLEKPFEATDLRTALQQVTL